MFLLTLRDEKLLFNGAHGDNGEYTISDGFRVTMEIPDGSCI
jgi:hypothetical protein